MQRYIEQTGWRYFKAEVKLVRIEDLKPIFKLAFELHTGKALFSMVWLYLIQKLI